MENCRPHPLEWRRRRRAWAPDGLAQHAERRNKEQTGDDGADDNLRPARRQDVTADCSQQNADIGDEFVARAKPCRTHIQVVATVPVEQHESNQIRDQRQPSYFPHCCYGRHDRMEYFVRRFTKNTEPKDEHEGALRKRGAGLPPCRAREHKEAERR